MNVNIKGNILMTQLVYNKYFKANNKASVPDGLDGLKCINHSLSSSYGAVNYWSNHTGRESRKGCFNCYPWVNENDLGPTLFHKKIDFFLYGKDETYKYVNYKLNMFNSNLMASRNKATKNRSLKYVLSRTSYKIISDFKKYFWLIPFKGYIRNKNV